LADVTVADTKGSACWLEPILADVTVADTKGSACWLRLSLALFTHTSHSNACAYQHYVAYALTVQKRRNHLWSGTSFSIGGGGSFAVMPIAEAKPTTADVTVADTEGPAKRGYGGKLNFAWEEQCKLNFSQEGQCSNKKYIYIEKEKNVQHCNHVAH